MRLIVLLLFFPVLVWGDELASERTWKGTNGKSIIGLYLRTLPDNKRVEIANSQGKVFTIDIANLSAPDRKLIEEGNVAKKELIAPKGDASLFKQPGPIDRTLIGMVPAEDDGMKWTDLSNCSVASHFLWWEFAGWIPSVRRGDGVKKALFLDKELKRGIDGRKGKVPSKDDIMKGMAKYFEDNLKESATFRFHVDPILTPANFVKYTSGGDACLLYVSAGSYGLWLPLISAKETCEMSFSCYNKTIKAKWVESKEPVKAFASFGFMVPMAGSDPVNWHAYGNIKNMSDLKGATLVISNREDLPNWLQNSKFEFSLSPKSPMVVCRPYIYSEEGKVGPPPVEPGFGPSAEEK